MMNPVDDARDETIGGRLRRLRVERGLSQRELAEPGVSYAYISRIEAGSRSPSVKALRKLARKLGVSSEYLETGSEIAAEEDREMRLADAELELRLSDDREAAEQRLRDVLLEALDAGDLAAAARARIALGSSAAAHGFPGEAVALLEEAIASDTIDAGSRPDVFAQLGRAYAAMGDTTRAVDLFERCLRHVEDDEPENTAARLQYSIYLSHALTDAEDFSRAHAVLAEALTKGEELADPYTRIKLYWSLARVSSLRGRPTEALRYARRAVALLEATEDTVQLGRAHLLCGAIHVAEGRPDEALGQLRKAEVLIGPRPSPADRAYLRTEQAKAAVMLGRGEDAAKAAREALDALGATDPAEQGAAWKALAEGLDLQGELPAAIEAFRRATEALEQADKIQEAAEAYRAWGRALRAAGRESEALDVLERAAELAVQGRRTEARANA